MKEELRNKYIEVRKNILNKEDKDKIILSKVINNNKVITSNTILIYVSMKDEVDTINLIKYFLGKKMVAVPKIENKVMKFYYIDSLDDLSIGYFGILEPTSNKLVSNYYNSVSITPGIVYSQDGYRIGYGGGYYDKFYSNYPGYKIGLCYKECLTNKLYHDNLDVPVDEVISD